MKKNGLLLGLNLVVSLMALGAGSAAIALHLWDSPADEADTDEPPPPQVAQRPPRSGQAIDLETGSAQIADITERCLPSVVNISTTRTVENAGAGNPFFDLLRQFLGPGAGPPTPETAQSLGSGVIISADGLVVTNHHVIADATEIRVVLSDESEYPATLVGSDPESDVALLRLTGAQNLTPLPYGDSSEIRQGDVVLAIGNPFGVGQTVTMGIVSATGRAAMGIIDYEDFIQTDAAINPGNSGGALVNLRGQLVGINTAILSRTGGSHGIGFAIPSNMARPIADALQRSGRVTRGYLGATLQDLTPQLARTMGLPQSRGVVIMDLAAGGPAANSDLHRGDVITRLDSEAIRSSRQLRNLIATRGAGTSVQITRARGQDTRAVAVTLGERPAAEPGGGPGIAPDANALAGATDVGGLLVQPLTDALRSEHGISSQVQSGVVIVGTRDGSPGASANVREGDVVVEINGTAVTSPEQLVSEFNRALFVAMLGVRRGVDTRIVMLPRS